MGFMFPPFMSATNCFASSKSFKFHFCPKPTRKKVFIMNLGIFKLVIISLWSNFEKTNARTFASTQFSQVFVPFQK